jgi:hypothetical protein
MAAARAAAAAAAAALAQRAAAAEQWREEGEDEDDPEAEAAPAHVAPGQACGRVLTGTVFCQSAQSFASNQCQALISKC